MRQILFCFCIPLLAVGCVHTPAPPHALPPGAPTAAEVLSDLARPDRVIANFASGGKMWIRLPGEAATQYFPTSYVRFREPAQFFARAVKGPHLVEVLVDGDQYLLQVRRERRFYYGQDAVQLTPDGPAIAPSAVFRELFLVDTLAELDPAETELIAFEEQSGRAELVVYRDARPRARERKITVERGAEGWQIVENLLYGGSGTPVAQTFFRDYERVDQVFLPRTIETFFPESADAAGKFQFQIPVTAQLNRAEPPEMLDIAQERAALLAAGFEEISGPPVAERVR